MMPLLFVIVGVIILFVGLVLYVRLYSEKNKKGEFINLYHEYYTLDWYKNQNNIVLKCIEESCNYETIVNFETLEKKYFEAEGNLEAKKIVYFDCPVCKNKKVIPLDFYKNSNYFKNKK